MEHVVDGVARTPKAVAGDLREIHVADRKGRNVAVAIDPQGKLHYGKDNVLGDHAIAILGEQVSDEYLSELREDGVSYLFAGLKMSRGAANDSFTVPREISTFVIQRICPSNNTTQRNLLVKSLHVEIGFIDRINVAEGNR